MPHDEIDFWELIHQPLSKQNAQLFGKIYEEKENQKPIKKQQRAPESLIVTLSNNQKKMQDLLKKNKAHL